MQRSDSKIFRCGFRIYDCFANMMGECRSRALAFTCAKVARLKNRVGLASTDNPSAAGAAVVRPGDPREGARMH